MRWSKTSLVLAAWAGSLATAIVATGQQAQDARAAGKVGSPASQPGYNQARDTTDPTPKQSLDAIALFDLEVPVVVTAARREQNATAVPHAVSVITARDIRLSNARSVADALRLVPGVDVADLSFGDRAVSPRGFHGFISRQTLVLVDGRQIFDSLFGGTLWGSWPFQLEDIERIEVIRGPGGVTWGANAVNGVINIITKDPANTTGATVTLGGGSRGWHKEHLGYGFADEKFRLRVSGEYEASDGFLRGGSIVRALEDDKKAGRVSLFGVYEKSQDDTFTFSIGNALDDGGHAPMPLAGLGQRRNAGAQSSFLLGKWAHRIAADNRFEITAYVNDFWGSPGVPALDYRYQQIALLFNHTFNLTDRHTLTWGVDGRADLLDGGNADPFMLSKNFVSTGIIGVYLQDEWRFAENWALNVGGRLDYEFYGGLQPSGLAALSYRISANSVIHAKLSRAFQMPPAGLRFVDIPVLNGLARAFGSRDLDAELLSAMEVGYRTKLFDRLMTSLNIYWNEYDDIVTISPRPGPPGLLAMNLDNRGDASTYGVEFETRYDLTEQLTLLGHYTFQKLDWRSSAQFHETDLSSPPEHKAMLGVRYSATEDVHLSSHLYYVGETKTPNPANPFFPRDVPEYFRLDLRAEYEFWNKQAAVSVGVRNLLDSNHYEGGTLFLNDAETPRMIFAELRLSFD